MTPQPELVGQEAVATEPVHGQIFFEGRHEVLGLATGEVEEAGEYFERSRLTRSVRPQETDHFAWLDLK